MSLALRPYMNCPALARTSSEHCCGHTHALATAGSHAKHLPINRIVVYLVAGLVSAVAASCSDAKKCEGNLAAVGAGCPDTFDGKLESFPTCSSDRVIQSSWRCGDLIALSSSGYAGLSCYYDFSSHGLVGAYEWSDVPEFCGDAFSEVAGRMPPQSCSHTDDLVERSCREESPVDGGV
jgi:hypothetical protein